MRIRVLVADDNNEMRDKIIQLLTPDFEIVGSASDGTSAYDAVLLLEPDIIVLDISMPVMSGIETARKILNDGSVTKTVFLTVHDDPDFVRTAFKAGASGYVVKSQMATDLLPALRAAIQGKHFISPSCALT